MTVISLPAAVAVNCGLTGSPFFRFHGGGSTRNRNVVHRFFQYLQLFRE
ncbi:MAG: hypothetical protein LBH00_08960 [Planctomycetaceae bacterium]|nr:hypothetical protein [Planctomycetaceae bacterium]